MAAAGADVTKTMPPTKSHWLRTRRKNNKNHKNKDMKEYRVYANCSNHKEIRQEYAFVVCPLNKRWWHLT